MPQVCYGVELRSVALVLHLAFPSTPPSITVSSSILCEDSRPERLSLPRLWARSLLFERPRK